MARMNTPVTGGEAMTREQEREKAESCGFCDRETEDLKYYSGGRGGWLCYICARTPASNVELYPTVHQDTDVDVLRTVVWCTWKILDALGAKP